MKKPNLGILDRGGLIKAYKLTDPNMWEKYVGEDPKDKSIRQLRKEVYDKINPYGKSWRDQYKDTLKFFDIRYDFRDSVEDMKEMLYDHRRKEIEERISEMDEGEKEKLADQLEDELSDEDLEVLKDSSKVATRTGTVGKAAGTAVLHIQGVAIALTGSNLGVCMLLTSGLSSVSTAVGVAFPFAAYSGAAALGGQALAAAGIVANPAVTGPLAAVGAAGLGWYAYVKSQNKQYAHLAGVNYLLESRKRLT